MCLSPLRKLNENSGPADFQLSQVVEVDALRTRSELACFRESPEVQRRVERLLTYYCKTSGISCVLSIDDDRGVEGGIHRTAP